MTATYKRFCSYLNNSAVGKALDYFTIGALSLSGALAIGVITVMLVSALVGAYPIPFMIIMVWIVWWAMENLVVAPCLDALKRLGANIEKIRRWTHWAS